MRDDRLARPLRGLSEAGATDEREAPPTLETVRLPRPDDFVGWRDAARSLLARAISPEAIVWSTGGGTADLFSGEGATAGIDGTGDDAAGGLRDGARRASRNGQVPHVPGAFLELAERVVCHREPGRFALLYRVLWRLARGETGLLSRASDADVHRLHALGKAVARERHKMHAFVRFRRTPGVEPEHYGAWFEPEHHTLRLASGFFVRRFANMRWSIVTPEESAHWDTRTLVFGPGGRRGSLPDDRAMEALWQTYFASIFNPARLKLDAMRAEMPVKYWKNLPEARLIAPLVHAAGGRVARMVAAAPSAPPRFAARATATPVAAGTPSASSARGPTETETEPAGRGPTSSRSAPRDASPDPGPRVAEGGVSTSSAGAIGARTPVPVDVTDLAALHAHTARCTLCEHACRATRAVNGEGEIGAPLMLVGEQAGDREDLAGRPFVGPAGALLRGALEALGADPAELFLTNAVRHFRHEPRGKRRLHRTPTVEHVDRCRRFLFEEIRLVRPRVIVALGATAGRALTGRAVAIERERGRVREFGEGITLVQSLHPASILRAPDGGTRDTREAALRDDLALALVAARGGPERDDPGRGESDAGGQGAAARAGRG